MEKHMFDVEIAKKFGVPEAIILEHMHFWIKHNKANGTHFYDGHYWTYNSIKAFLEIFPYFSKKQLENYLKKLVDHQLIITGNYNETTYNRTKWYALTDKGLSLFPDLIDEEDISQKEKCISPNGEMDLPKRGNGSYQMGKSYNNNIYIYNNNTDNIPVNKTDINTPPTPSQGNESVSKTNKTIPPTLEMVKEYCETRKNGINPHEFWDFYEARGWLIGKNKMKDWQASVRTWEAKRGVKVKDKEELEEIAWED